MSKGFAIALAAALVIVPSTAGISTAEESQAELKQGCCDKNKECRKDSTCTACKYKDCKNAECDLENCAREGCENANGKCSASRFASCDESGCRGDASGYAGCSKADCAAGKCGSELSCDALTVCADHRSSACQEKSALRLTGQSLFMASPSAASLVTDEMWQIVADELDQLAWRRCDSNAPKEFVYLILDNGADGDCAIQTECNDETTVSSVLRGAILPNPVNFAAAEIAVRRNRSVVNDDATIEAEEKILPVRWDEATGQPTKCTNHALQPNDRLCVNLTGSADAPPNAIATAYTKATPTTINNFMQRRPQGETENESVTQIQYSIQIIEDSRGCMSEYDDLRRGAPMMFAESRTLLPAIRMLEKNRVIRQLSSPKLMCTAGQTAQLEIGSETPADGSESCNGLRLEVASETAENGLMLELALHATEQERRFEVRTALFVEPGQTIVLNANASPAPHDETKQIEPAVYIVLTPEVVK